MRARAIVVLSLALLACDAERRRLQEKAAMLEQEEASLAQRVEERRNTVRETNDRLDTLKRDLAKYNTNIQSFITAHRLAASCIRTARSTWGENNAFWREVSRTARLGVALCSVALLSRRFEAEVAYVADQLIDADAHVRKLQEQITAAEIELASDRSELEKSETAVREIGAEITDVRQQMDR